MTEFSRAIVALSDAVRDYEEASKTFGGDDAGNARDLLAELRTLREKIQQKSADSSDFRNVINFYNGVVQWINNTLPYAASRP